MNDHVLNVTKVTPRCGTNVCGIYLAQPLDESTVQTLEFSLVDHSVLFFRNQKMTAGKQNRLGSYYGTLHLHPAWHN